MLYEKSDFFTASQLHSFTASQLHKFFFFTILLNFFSFPSFSQFCSQQAVENCKINTNATFKLISNSANFSDLIAQQALLPVASSAMTPQFLIVCGKLTNNLVQQTYTFAQGSEIIFTTNEAGIDINSGCNLSIIASNLHGCKKLWAGILVKSNGNLQMKSSAIEDARIGVKNMNSSSSIINACTFEGNHIGISLGEEVLPQPTYAIKFSMQNTTISGMKPLLEKVSVQSFCNCFELQPAVGIEILSCKTISIGTNLENLNEITNFNQVMSCNDGTLCGLVVLDRGVHAINSNLVIRGTRFVNISNIFDFPVTPPFNWAGQKTGAGVFFDRTGNFPCVFKLTGLGSLDNSIPTFKSCAQGILGGGIYSVTNARFLNSKRFGINLGNKTLDDLAPPLPPVSYNLDKYHIENNLFDTYHLAGINTNWNSTFPATSLEIISNRFYDNIFTEFPLFNWVGRAGINMYSYYYFNGENFRIHQSNVFRVSQTSQNFGITHRGLNIGNIGNAYVGGNTFNDLNTSPNHPYTGLLVGKPTKIFSNVFNGAGNFSDHNSTGIYFDGASSCWVNCNILNNTKIGMNFRGNSCDGATLTLNNFNTHEVGLQLQPDAIISDQVGNLNMWNGTQSTTEAWFKGVDVVLNEQFIKLSELKIHETNQSTVFWPNPRQVGAAADNGTWVSEGVSNLPVVCEPVVEDGLANEFNIPSKITDFNLAIINDDFSPMYGFEENKYEAIINLYAKLIRNPELMPAGSVAASWFEQMQGTNFAKLGEILVDIHDNMLEMTPQDKAYFREEYNEIEQKVDEIINIDEQIAEISNDVSTNPGFDIISSELESQRGLFNEEIRVKSNEIATKLNNCKAQSIGKAKNVLEKLGNINADEPYEEDIKWLLTVYANSVYSGFLPSQDEQKKMLEIAQKCHYSGGLAVKLARDFVSERLNWEKYDDCTNEGTQNRNANSGKEVNILIQPNPATDNFSVKFDGVVTEGKIILRDIHSKVVNIWTINNSSEMSCVLPGELSSGIFFVELQIPNEKSTIHRLIISKK